MANLVIDIGNTALKASWCDGVTIGRTFRYQGEKMMDFILSIIEKEKPDIMVLSSLRNFSTQNINKLESCCEKLVIADRVIFEKYSIPGHLTPDRAASIIASRYLFNGRDCTIFDFGTTMTVDFIDADGNYSGGNVSLGCRMRFKALNRYAKSLPLLDTPLEITENGYNLSTSIESGVISGMMFEISGYILQHPENVNVFTGGDAIYFAKRMKNSIFVVCNLVLMGLALIAVEYDRKD
ncbi:MAG: type III pantothenate kinase [Bacteroidales bacterium]|nr:type III pantothenate kinase [Bacteroidales bacterium]